MRCVSHCLAAASSRVFEISFYVMSNMTMQLLVIKVLWSILFCAQQSLHIGNGVSTRGTALMSPMCFAVTLHVVISCFNFCNLQLVLLGPRRLQHICLWSLCNVKQEVALALQQRNL